MAEERALRAALAILIELMLFRSVCVADNGSRSPQLSSCELNLKLRQIPRQTCTVLTKRRNFADKDGFRQLHLHLLRFTFNQDREHRSLVVGSTLGLVDFFMLVVTMQRASSLVVCCVVLHSST